jgi:hypothetical protein
MKRFLILIYTFSLIHLLPSCKTDSSAGEVQMPVVSVKAEPPVIGTIENEINFNGSTVYLKKSQVISPMPGYIVRTYVRFGQEVQKDMILFEIKTRESKVLESGNDKTEVSGAIMIHASTDGYINELNVNESGVYVAEGSLLCNIVNNKDLMIKLNIPYENISILSGEKKCKIRLVDNTVINGSVFRILPSVEGSNQTQTVLIKPRTDTLFPENLNILVSFVKDKHDKAQLVSKSSLMTNETQSEFWIMKIDTDNKAVKIPVVKGLENDSLVEIISPDLSSNNLIISQGAYGLPDSTIVTIVN